MLNQILRPFARRAILRGTQNRLAHHESHFKKVTFDEAPAPEGSWKENFAKQQMKYNIHLLVGIGSLALTILAVNQFELIFFNFSPPKPKDA